MQYFMMNLFAKGMDVLHDDRHIRKQHIGLFATNLINTVRSKSNIPLTHPPKLANQRIMPPHTGSQQPPPLARYRAFSLTRLASMLMYWNKRKHLHEKRVKLPEDFLGTPTWPPFHCFGTPIWPPWRRVKKLYTSCNALKNLPAETRQATPQSLLPQYMQTDYQQEIRQPSIVRENRQNSTLTNSGTLSDSTVEIPKELISFFRLIKSFISY